MTETLAILGGVALVHFFGAASPGPSVVLITRTAAVDGRAAALWMALAIGLGGAVWAAAAVFGLALVFAAAPWLYQALKLAGAACLLWLALQMRRHAETPLDEAADGARLGPAAAFKRALAIQLANPKVMVFFGSVFVAFVPEGSSAALLGLIVFNVFVVEAVLFGIVALAFSAGPVRRGYIRAKAWIDRICGGALGLPGLRLALG
ncbi:MAG: LysE family translocator [Pseudomonadota bacterium]